MSLFGRDVVIWIHDLITKSCLTRDKEVLDILQKIVEDERCKGIIDTLSNSDSTFNHLLRFL